jgi:hypothetical protein
MLTDYQLEELANKMNVPLAGIIFKNECPKKFEFNKSYIINLEDSYNEKGELQNGSHWTCLQINKYPNGLVEGIYFDPFGLGPPEDVKKCYKRTTDKEHLPYNTKDIQSMMSNACGWYCMAFLHFINNFSHRSKELYQDTDNFLEFFDDLNKSVEFKKNEYILKHFFQPKDPKLRKEISVFDTDKIVTDNNGGIDLTKVPLPSKYNK